MSNREEKLKLKFLKKYPEHGEDIVSSTPKKTNFVVNEFIKKQAKLMNEGYTEERAFQIVERKFLREWNDVKLRKELYSEVENRYNKSEELNNADKSIYEQSSFNKDYIRAANFTNWYKKNMGWDKVEQVMDLKSESNFDALVAALKKKNNVNDKDDVIDKHKKSNVKDADIFERNLENEMEEKMKKHEHQHDKKTEHEDKKKIAKEKKENEKAAKNEEKSKEKKDKSEKTAKSEDKGKEKKDKGGKKDKKESKDKK